MCGYLGFWPHPDYLYRFLSARQLAGWSDYAKTVGTIGLARDDIHWGMLGSTIASVNGNQAQPQDFMPYFDPWEEDITLEQLLSRALPSVSLKRKKHGTDRSP